MSNSTIRFLKTRDVISPSRAHADDAGIDFYVPEFTGQFLIDLREKNPDIIIDNEKAILESQQRILIPSGIHCQMSGNDKALIAFNKSGVASKLGLTVGSAVVDVSYQGEVHLSLINTSNRSVRITPGMKIIQFIELPIFTSDILVEENKSLKEFYEKETERGPGGFGSTNTQRV